MGKIKDIPEQKVADDSGFYVPAARLVAAIKEYYQREQGVQPTAKQVEDQAIKIIRTQT